MSRACGCEPKVLGLRLAEILFFSTVYAQNLNRKRFDLPQITKNRITERCPNLPASNRKSTPNRYRKRETLSVAEAKSKLGSRKIASLVEGNEKIKINPRKEEIKSSSRAANYSLQRLKIRDEVLGGEFFH